MNTPTVHDLFLAAYEILGGRPDIQPENLLSVATNVYVHWRNAKIQEWATAVYEKHGRSLLRHTDVLLSMVARVDEYYHHEAVTSDMWADDDDDIAVGIAYLASVVRWYSNVHAGRVQETLPATAEDARQWLEQYGIAPVKAGQMSLFLGV